MPRLRHLAPTGDWILACVPSFLVFIITALDREYQIDFWHHLARGRAIVAQGQIVNVDLFCYTLPADLTFQDVNWLTQVFYYRLYLLGGFDLVQLINSLTLAGMIALLVHFCRRASGSLRLACALGIFAVFAFKQMLTIRPQTFSLFLFILLYEVLDLSERRPWLLVVPPPGDDAVGEPARGLPDRPDPDRRLLPGRPLGELAPAGLERVP